MRWPRKWMPATKWLPLTGLSVEARVQLSMLEILTAVSAKAVPPVPSAAGTIAAWALARFCQVPPQPAHTHLFSSSHTKPLTLNFQLVNLPARFPNRWQVLHMRKISISSPICRTQKLWERLAYSLTMKSQSCNEQLDAWTSRAPSSGLKARVGPAFLPRALLLFQPLLASRPRSAGLQASQRSCLKKLSGHRPYAMNFQAVSDLQPSVSYPCITS